MGKTAAVIVLGFFSLTLSAQTASYQWLTSVSGINDDVARGVCLDSLSNVYITGSFSGTTTIGGETLTSNGASDLFIAKFNSTGNLDWAKSFGSVSLDYAFDIDCNSGDGVYITGGFRQTMTLPPNIVVNSTGGLDVFIAKFDTNGNCLWIRTTTGTASEYGNEIVTTTNGNVAVIGTTQGTLIIESDTLAHIDSTDLFLVKYDVNGTKIWSKGLPGMGHAAGRAISSDDFENTVAAGSFQGNIQLDSVILTSTISTDNDVFVSKIAADGTLIWAKQFGGAGDDYARGIDTDANGYIYLSGVFSDSVDFDGITLIASGSSDVFLMKLDSWGHRIWVQKIGNGGSEEGCEIEVDDDGEIFVTGCYSQAITLGPTTFSSNGFRDVFIAKLDSSGNFIWAKTAGSVQDDVNYAIGLNRINEDICTTGTYSGTFSDGSNSITSIGGVDSYISKIHSNSLVGIDALFGNESKLNLYPNPAATVIHINCEKGFQIYSSTGQLVKQSARATNQLNIVDLPSGLYFMKSDGMVGRFMKSEQPE